MEVRAEFTVYPFEEGESPPPHVAAAIAEIERRGIQVTLGPLGQLLVGPAEGVLEALRAGQIAALEAGATRITISVQAEP